MCRYLYGLLTETKLGSIDLLRLLELAKKYNKIKSSSDSEWFEAQDGNECEYALVDSDSPVFIHADSNTCAAFHGNLMFTFFQDEISEDTILRIHIKEPEDKWRFARTSDGQFEVLTPLNTNAEVYVYYDVNVLKLDRCFGQSYKSGTWNKMFYRALRSFIEEVEGFTEINRIKKAYKK